MTNQRLADLVRHQRHALHDAGLISDDEYAEILQDPVAVDSLEDYDALRRKQADIMQANRMAQVLLDQSWAEVAELKAEVERLRGWQRFDGESLSELNNLLTEARREMAELRTDRELVELRRRGDDLLKKNNDEKAQLWAVCKQVDYWRLKAELAETNTAVLKRDLDSALKRWNEMAGQREECLELLRDVPRHIKLLAVSSTVAVAYTVDAEQWRVWMERREKLLKSVGMLST